VSLARHVIWRSRDIVSLAAEQALQLLRNSFGRGAPRCARQGPSSRGVRPSGVPPEAAASDTQRCHWTEKAAELPSPRPGPVGNTSHRVSHRSRRAAASCRPGRRGSAALSEKIWPGAGMKISLDVAQVGPRVQPLERPRRAFGQRGDCDAVPGSAARAKRISAESECEPVFFITAARWFSTVRWLMRRSAAMFLLGWPASTSSMIWR
jgi:hypothetical protein